MPGRQRHPFIQLKKMGVETGSQSIWVGEYQPHKDQQSETLWTESFTVSTAEARMVQIFEGRASPITETVHHY